MGRGSRWQKYTPRCRACTTQRKKISVAPSSFIGAPDSVVANNFAVIMVRSEGIAPLFVDTCRFYTESLDGGDSEEDVKPLPKSRTSEIFAAVLQLIGARIFLSTAG